MNHNPAVAAEVGHIKTALQNLRTHFPGGTPDLEILSAVLQNGHGTCSPKTVEAFAQQRGTFSTADVMQHFQVSKYKVAGALAALTRSKVIEKQGETDANGYSTYTYKGPKSRRKK